MSGATQFELAQPPTDGISSMRFASTSDLLLVSSWDSGVRLYDVQQNSLRARFDGKAPILATCFSGENTHAFTGGLDKSVRMCEFRTGSQTTLGTHDEAVRCLDHMQFTGNLVSGSWDGTAKIWDYRLTSPLVETLKLDGKVFTMASSEYRLVVGTSGRQIYIYDVRKTSEPEQKRESSLKHQTRCLRIFPNGQAKIVVSMFDPHKIFIGFAQGSTEGKVVIEYFDQAPEVQKKKYAFKCHRHNINGIDTIFPVNAIAFHPGYGTFATGGCDGYVSMWDGENKKKIAQLPKYPTSIASVEFNHNGSLLAVASSYTYEEGERDHPADAIFIRSVSDSEVKSKPKAPKQ